MLESVCFNPQTWYIVILLQLFANFIYALNTTFGLWSLQKFGCNCFLFQKITIYNFERQRNDRKFFKITKK